MISYFCLYICLFRHIYSQIYLSFQVIKKLVFQSIIKIKYFIILKFLNIILILENYNLNNLNTKISIQNKIALFVKLIGITIITLDNQYIKQMLLQIQKYHLNKFLQKYSFQHLRPPPQVLQIIIPQQSIFRQAGPNQKRRHIFWHVEYTDKQNEAIQHILSNLHNHNIFQKFTEQIVLKHLYATKFDYDDTFQRLIKLQEYHNNKMVTKFTRDTQRRLESGCIYSYGYDKQMRPILISRADILSKNLKQYKSNKNKTQMQILQNFNCVYYLLLIVMNFKMNPYHNEKYNNIFDFNDMDFNQIPLMTMYDIFSRMNIYYCGTTQKTFVYNWKGIQKLWNIGKKLIPERAIKNIVFIQKGKQSQILQYVSEMQLQKKYGGALQNLTKYWPPQSTNASFDQVNMSQISQKTAFYSVQNDIQYFVDKQQQNPAICGQHCSCQIF